MNSRILTVAQALQILGYKASHNNAKVQTHDAIRIREYFKNNTDMADIAIKLNEEKESKALKAELKLFMKHISSDKSMEKLVTTASSVKTVTLAIIIVEDYLDNSDMRTPDKVKTFMGIDKVRSMFNMDSIAFKYETDKYNEAEKILSSLDKSDLIAELIKVYIALQLEVASNENDSDREIK